MSGHTYIHTYTHTHTHDNHSNPRCAHAHRGLSTDKLATKIIGCRVYVVGGASRKCSRNFAAITKFLPLGTHAHSEIAPNFRGTNIS